MKTLNMTQTKAHNAAKKALHEAAESVLNEWGMDFYRVKLARLNEKAGKLEHLNKLMDNIEDHLLTQALNDLKNPSKDEYHAAENIHFMTQVH